MMMRFLSAFLQVHGFKNLFVNYMSRIHREEVRYILVQINLTSAIPEGTDTYQLHDELQRLTTIGGKLNQIS